MLINHHLVGIAGQFLIVFIPAVLVAAAIFFGIYFMAEKRRRYMLSDRNDMLKMGLPLGGAVVLVCITAFSYYNAKPAYISKLKDDRAGCGLNYSCTESYNDELRELGAYEHDFPRLRE